jgi:hypothetical protein
MSCSGLHCAGCAGGVALPVVPLLELYGAVWLAGHIVEVIVTCAVCGVLAVAAAVALSRWADRRDARRAAAWEPRYVRALPAAPRPAIAPVYNLNFYGVPADERAAVIRNAIEGSEPQLRSRVHSRALAC